MQNTLIDSVKLCAEYYGNPMPVMAVMGSCHGISFKIEPDALTFGAVCLRCRVSRKLILTNTGDVGARYLFEYTLSVNAKNK